MKLIKTVDSVGCVLAHDMTQIIKGVTKDAVFRKGHVVTEEDIPVLLSIGKDSLYVWENDENMMHEDEAVKVLVELCQNDYMKAGNVKEGKVELSASVDGLLKINREALKLVNSYGQLMIASRHGNFAVKTGDKICGTRIIPLVIEKEKMEDVKKKTFATTNNEPIFKILPFTHHQVGILTTGNEVYYKRIEDTFTPVILDKLSEFDCDVIAHDTLNDDDQKETQSILKMIDQGADVIICTGGMSVDPDDKTPLAIKNTGADIVSYGSPVLPGAMFLLAYYHKDNGETVTIMGLPGCAMYNKRTIFDLILPRVMANDVVSTEDLYSLGEGGLCLNCQVCTFPNCGFGKGK
ncbi:MAG: molybdopterin-binding protein [Erysipelotrichaceae bacterium]|nr:molybdopterin-binding protein [Erysipelotrichaceae bacterium]